MTQGCSPYDSYRSGWLQNVCRNLLIAHYPTTVFMCAFRQAEATVEWQLNNNEGIKR
jgi:hypothetical protein